MLETIHTQLATDSFPFKEILKLKLPESIRLVTAGGFEPPTEGL
jgi:hypothetical protein